MTTTEPPLTPLGKLLEDARKVLGLSKREAARRSGYSEGRWRQVVTGLQNTKDVNTPSNPKSSTVAAMARAVGVDVDEALRVAGLDATPGAGASTPGDPIRRVMLSELPDEQKRRIVQVLLQEQREAERRQRQRAEELIEAFREQD